ncbi:hypothetical protein [Helicobacter pylori]|nr:hypothetical protein [Helicobacter pylori]
MSSFSLAWIVLSLAFKSFLSAISLLSRVFTCFWDFSSSRAKFELFLN